MLYIRSVEFCSRDAARLLSPSVHDPTLLLLMPLLLLSCPEMLLLLLILVDHSTELIRRCNRRD